MLNLVQQITDNTSVTISNKTDNDMERPAFVPLDSVSGSERIIRFQLINTSSDKQYTTPSVSVNTTDYGDLPDGLTVKLIAQAAKPSSLDWDGVSTLNTLSLSTMGPGDIYTIWMNVKYTGALSENLTYPLEETISDLTLDVDTTEVEV